VKFQGSLSSRRLLLYGLPDLKLFPVIISDISLSETDLGYVDDWAIFQEALSWEHLEQSIQARFDEIEAGSIENRIFFNPGKCKVLMHRSFLKLYFRFNDSILPVVEEVKYLGIIFKPPKASFEHTLSLPNYQMYSKVMKSIFPGWTLGKIQYCPPILMYLSRNQENLLETRYRYTFKATLGLPSSAPNAVI
jgi:hypothetical protein